MPDNKKLKHDIIQKFGTPCSVIDLGIVDRNIAHIQGLYDKAKLTNRPHVKDTQIALFSIAADEGWSHRNYLPKVRESRGYGPGLHQRDADNH